MACLQTSVSMMVS